QAEDGIRDFHVTGVQTCALPISKMIWLSSEIRALSAGSRPIVAREVTDLPLPDSPTSATVVLAGISKETPFTVSIYSLFSPLKLTRRFSTRSSADAVLG